MDGVYTVQFDLKRCLTGSADRILRYGLVQSFVSFEILLRLMSV